MRPETLSEMFPLCKKHGLTLHYKMQYGPHVMCDQVEKVLADLTNLLEFLDEKVQDLQKEWNHAEG